MRLFSKQPKPPTFQEQVNLQADAQLRNAEVEDVLQPIPFDSKILEDEQYHVYFNPKLPTYSPAYEPMRLMFSRLLRLGNMTPEEVKEFKRMIHATAQRAHALCESRLEHYIVQSQENYLRFVVSSHARLGFFFRTMTENRKTLQLIQGRPEKRRRVPW